jgi:hypothetical protein
MNILKIILMGLAIGSASFAVAQDRGSALLTDQAKQVKLFPNPATEFLTIKFETPQARKVKLVLHNIIGGELETEAEIIDDFEVRIKVKDLSTGFYLLLIRNDETGVKTANKFLKK